MSIKSFVLSSFRPFFALPVPQKGISSGKDFNATCLLNLIPLCCLEGQGIKMREMEEDLCIRP